MSAPARSRAPVSGRFAPLHVPPALRLTDLLALSRQRRALADLDPHVLADIGLTRDEALTEARRPIWDVPESWRR